MMKTTRIATLLLAAFATTLLAAQPQKPNIVFILADDLGYGDIQCFNPATGKIKTPNLDRLASEGMMFTDAHSGSAVCTPTRYGVLTGRYSWRTRLKSGVLGGFSPPLIEPGRLTVPGFLKQHGYGTVCIGKWHLGMDWPRVESGQYNDAILGNARDTKEMNAVDWRKRIANGPTTKGFDYYFGISASLDMPPYLFIENDRVTAIPTTEKKWIRTGPAAEDFEAVDVLPTLAAKTIEQIKARADAAKSGTPFFIYLPLASPHTPVVPSPAWQGKSGISDYADFVMQTDAAVGEVLAALDSQGLRDNTLVIFTSDNGFSPAGDPDHKLPAAGHNPSAGLRGHKADIWDGGHRVPFIARWPAKVKAGTRSTQLIGLQDLMATCAEILKVRLPDNAGEDSMSFLPALLGKTGAPMRDSLVHHSINGSFAVREGPWKLDLCPGSGGWSDPRPGSAAEKELPPVQLYNMSADIGEQENLQAEHPEKVARLRGLLETWQADGRSTLGAKQPPAEPVPIRAGKRTGQSARARGDARPYQPGDKLNVVFFLADDLGYMDIGAYNPNTFYHTPNINKLATKGMRFTSGYAACPVCSPTRASIMTGKYPQRTGITDYIGAAQPEKWNRPTRLLPAPYEEQLALKETTLGEAFKANGYATFFAGKWHLGPTNYWPENQGFDINMGGIDRGGPYGGNKYFSPYGNPRLPDGPPGEHLPDRLAQEALKFIEANRERPFFAYLSFYSVHTPLMAREDLRKKYEAKAKTLPVTDPAWGQEGERKLRLVQDHAVYAGMVEAMDQAVGKVLDELERAGLGDRTIVVFTSDNGGLSTSEGHPTSNLPLRAGKGWLYEGGIREPWIIRAPGITREGSLCDAPVISPDFYPTLLELAGLRLRPKQHLDGTSLVPLLKGGHLAHAPLFWHYPHYGNQGGAPGGSVRDGDWKLIEWYENGKLELFNLRDDLGEKNNVAAANPSKVKELQAQLATWRQKVGARMPSPNPKYSGQAPSGPSGKSAKQPRRKSAVPETSRS